MLLTMPRTKTKMLTVKVSPLVAKEFMAASKSRGGTMAGLIHMFVVRTIKEERDSNPEGFRKALESGVRVASKTLTLKRGAKQKKA